MKIEITILIVDAIVYQIVIKFIMSFVIIEFVTQAKIIVFDETSIIQIQLINVTKFYF